MKKILFSILVSIFIISCSINTTAVKYQPWTAYKSLPKNTETQFFYEYGEGFFIFTLFNHRTQYRLLGDERDPLITTFIKYKKYGSTTEVESLRGGNIFNIDGNIVRYNITILDSEVRNEEKYKKTIEIKIDEKIVYSIDYDVIVIPVRRGTSYEEILNILGPPDIEEKGATDTWSNRNNWGIDLQNRYRPYWRLKYNKFPNSTIFLNENGSMSSVINGSSI